MYHKVKMNILVAFSTSDKFYAKILRKIMKSHIHHTFLFVELEGFGLMALEINQDGIRFVSSKRVMRYARRIECFEYIEDLTPGLLSMKDYLGKKYDWKGLIFGALRLLVKRYFHYESKKEIHNPNKMFCSEFVASVLKRSNVEGTQNWITSNISPKMLYDFIENSKLFREVTK